MPKEAHSNTHKSFINRNGRQRIHLKKNSKAIDSKESLELIPIWLIHICCLIPLPRLDETQSQQGVKKAMKSICQRWHNICISRLCLWKQDAWVSIKTTLHLEKMTLNSHSKNGEAQQSVEENEPLACFPTQTSLQGPVAVPPTAPFSVHLLARTQSLSVAPLNVDVGRPSNRPKLLNKIHLDIKNNLDYKKTIPVDRLTIRFMA